MIRTFLLSGAGSALSIALYALFVSTVGVGVGSDSFFAALAVAQGIGGLLYAPYESFAQRVALDRQRTGGAAALPLVTSYLFLSLIVLVPYYVWGQDLGRLFGRVYAADPLLWRYHLRVLGALIPLTGVVAIFQVCCQARERYELPKAATVVGRLVAITLYVSAGSHRLRAISVAVVVAQVVAAAIGAQGVGKWWGGLERWQQDVGAVLKEWFHVNRWTVLLKTDALLERVLAARVTSGFLSLFSIGWNVIMSVIEAHQSSYVVADSNTYYANSAMPSRESRPRFVAAYAKSKAAAARLTGMAMVGISIVSLAVLTSGWTPRWMNGMSRQQLVMLLVTLVIAQAVFFVWKQLQGAYTIQGRAVAFARGLALVYLVFVGPRILLTWRFGATGFCAGLVAYYGSQIAVLGRRV